MSEKVLVINPFGALIVVSICKLFHVLPSFTWKTIYLKKFTLLVI